jgi:hypothetical protein
MRCAKPANIAACLQKLLVDFERTLRVVAAPSGLAEVTERIIAARSAASEAPA